MFTMYRGEEAVKPGTYLGIKSGEFITIDRDGGNLPGPEGARYVKVSPVVALLVGPLAGLAFVIFLPLAVPALMIWLVAGKLWRSAPGFLQRFGNGLAPAYAIEGRAVAPRRPEDQGKDARSLEALLDEMASKLEGDDKH